MPWVEAEEDGGSWILIVGFIALAVGGLVWRYRGFWTGVFAYLGVITTAGLARQFWLDMRLPREARRAAKLVLAWFRERYPEERIESVAVRAIESDHYVIAVRHGFGLPTPRDYFAIARPNLTEIMELPTADWWPRGLK